jgi:hypothetical protein
MTMKVAKADRQDLDAAMTLMGLLDTVSSGYYPSDSDKAEDDPLFFDADDPEHLAQLWKRLKACLDAAPGFQGRVIFGAATMMDPRNEVIDPDDDCLSLHPKLTTAMKDAERYRFLRGDGGPASVRWPRWEVKHWTGCWNPVQGEGMDAAIDAVLPEAIDEAMAMPANDQAHQGETA